MRYRIDGVDRVELSRKYFEERPQGRAWTTNVITFFLSVQRSTRICESSIEIWIVHFYDAVTTWVSTFCHLAGYSTLPRTEEQEKRREFYLKLTWERADISAIVWRNTTSQLFLSLSIVLRTIEAVYYRNLSLSEILTILVSIFSTYWLSSISSRLLVIVDISIRHPPSLSHLFSACINLWSLKSQYKGHIYVNM